jgi:hypothetical protein
MPHGNGSRSPRAGDSLILADGRRFILTGIEDGVRGWWFTAAAPDGRKTLQGNIHLEWDPQALVWRPNGTREISPPHNLLHAPWHQPRYQQVE